jgi:FixJ family two-component response regulator
MNKTINEEWREVHGTMGRYMASNSGKIKSLYLNKNTILKPRINYRGYEQVSLSYHGNVKTKTVHRIVAMTFLAKPESRCDVNHKDGNKLNNHISNLEFISHSENVKHAYENGLISKAFGKNNGMNKLSETQVLAIKSLIHNGFKNKFIADQFNVNPATISDIKRGKIWNWLHSKTVEEIP